MEYELFAYFQMPAVSAPTFCLQSACIDSRMAFEEIFLLLKVTAAYHLFVVPAFFTSRVLHELLFGSSFFLASGG